MARYPAATWRPLADKTTLIVPTTVILHSAVTPGGAKSLFGHFSKANVPLESHFYLRMDGTCEQYVDTAQRADANNKANAFAISIETEDNGRPDLEPWTKAQLDALVALVDWCCTTHKIPRRQAPTWNGGGIGYHTMFGAPSPWTPVVKTCPGKARIAQFPDVVKRVVALEAPPVFPLSPIEDDDMPGPMTEAKAAGDFVLDLYDRIAGKPPDPAGYNYWLGLLLDGMSPATVTQNFAAAVAAGPA